MKTPLQIVTDIKFYISNSNLFRFPHSEEVVLHALNELETLFLNQEETPQPDANEEPTVGEILEVTFTEPILVEEPIYKSTIEVNPVEEAVTEKPVVAKKGRKSK